MGRFLVSELNLVPGLNGSKFVLTPAVKTSQAIGFADEVVGSDNGQ